jgi:translocation and assembly module TamB
MTIADDDGVWLTIRQGAIGWNRSALLSGRIEIAEMSAAEIDLPRAPVSQPSTPSAEAPGFTLPELPVSVEIGALTVARLRLGADLLGSAAEVSLTGALSLAGGAGTTDLAVRRIDGAEGDLSLTGAFSNATGRATVDLLVSEGAGGIAADLIGLPGRPAIRFSQRCRADDRWPAATGRHGHADRRRRGAALQCHGRRRRGAAVPARISGLLRPRHLA